jgi:drug/metabolite transporter (DMT)-like permease
MQQSQRLARLADLMLLLVAMVWGSSYGVAKAALFFYPVCGLLFLRFGITFLLLAPKLREAKTAGIRGVLQGLMLGVVLLGIFFCETFGVTLTRASNAAFLISLCVVLTPFAEWLLLARRPTRTELAAASLALLGAYLLTLGNSRTTPLNAGDGLILLAACLRALLVCMTKRFTRRIAMPALTLTALQAGVVALGSLAAGILIQPATLLPLPHQLVFWAYLAYMVVCCTMFAFFAQNYGIRHRSPTRVALLMGSEPAFGAVFAALWLHESLTPLAWAGGALMVLAALSVVLPVKAPQLVVSEFG